MVLRRRDLIVLSVVFLLSVLGLVLRWRRIDWPGEFYLAALLSLAAMLWPISPRLLPFLGLLFLSFCPLLLSLGQPLLADRAAATALIFFAGGVLRALLDLYRRKGEEEVRHG